MIADAVSFYILYFSVLNASPYFESIRFADGDVSACSRRQSIYL